MMCVAEKGEDRCEMGMKREYRGGVGYMKGG